MRTIYQSGWWPFVGQGQRVGKQVGSREVLVHAERGEGACKSAWCCVIHGWLAAVQTMDGWQCSSDGFEAWHGGGRQSQGSCRGRRG